MEETPIPFYVLPAPHFRLPEDPHTDLIMVGPGTGIAPFRAFMQERSAQNSNGNHLLFFGERSRKTDYFYEKEWDCYENLKIHTAFSRDGKEKIYVQHKMKEEGQNLYLALERGAHLYVCGDAKEMAKDVDKTLHQIIEEYGNMSVIEAKDYIKALKKAGRYLLDVY